MIQWLQTHRVMLVNTCSLVGTTAITSSLGFVYWWVVARRSSPDAIGMASAFISAMTLLGGGSIFGLNTLLITELPRQLEHARSLLSTALLAVSILGTGWGLLFALVAPSFLPAFEPIRASLLDIMTFSIGVGAYAITLVLDQALIGLLKGSLQFWRNTFFAVVKLGAIFLINYWPSSQGGMKLYATWVVSMLLSLGLIAAYAMKNFCREKRHYWPQWNLLRKLSFSSLKHYGLNTTLQAPTLLLPILVTLLLSPRSNAWFYVAWMIVSFVFVIPGALTMVLHAMNAAEQITLGRRVRLTISLSLLICILANLVLQFESVNLLSLFGKTYAIEASWCIRILALAAFPLIIKNHYISLSRIQDRVVQATVAMIPGGILELAGAILGARLAGLPGLSLGWVCAITIEAIVMFPTVYKVLQLKQSAPELIVKTIHSQYRNRQLNTISLQGGKRPSDPIWLNESLVQPLHATKGTIVEKPEGFFRDRITRLKPPHLQPYPSSSATISHVDETSLYPSKHSMERPL